MTADSAYTIAVVFTTIGLGFTLLLALCDWWFDRGDRGDCRVIAEILSMPHVDPWDKQRRMASIVLGVDWGTDNPTIVRYAPRGTVQNPSDPSPTPRRITPRTH